MSIHFNKSIGNKLALYFFLVILIPVITITGFGDLIYRSYITKAQNLNTEQMIKQISNNIDFSIKDTENVINYLSQDPRIITFLKDKFISLNSSSSQVMDEATSTITNFAAIHPEISGIMVVNSRDVSVSNVMDRISRDPLTNEKWYVEASKNPNKIHLFSKPIGRNIYSIFEYSADEIVSMSKAVLDKNNVCIGVILIDMRFDVIKSIIEDAKPANIGFVYIVDSTGEIVYTPVNKIVYRIREDWILNNNSNTLIKRIREKDYEIMHKRSKYTGWSTVGVFPTDESLKVVNLVKFYSFITAIVTLMAAGVLSIFFTKSIVNPISKLKKLMKKTEAGNFDVYFNAKYDDEIGELGRAFNNMIKEIKKLIRLVQDEEKKKRKAEISILHSQIKPHFLYNTLDTIQWMAQEHSAYDIIDMIRNLSNLLRIGLSGGEEIIRVRQEITHVESYLLIQKVRYEEKLNYEISVQEDIMDFRVTKLILQPIVENAIYHGIKEKRGGGHIKIIGELKGQKIHFIIQDDGIGIKEEKLAQINAVLSGEKAANDVIGYGIYNVNEKIRLSYGDEFGIKYYSIYGKGTIAEIWHPII